MATRWRTAGPRIPSPVPGVEPSRPQTTGPVASAGTISASWPKKSASRDCAERRDHFHSRAAAAWWRPSTRTSADGPGVCWASAISNSATGRAARK